MSGRFSRGVERFRQPTTCRSVLRIATHPEKTPAANGWCERRVRAVASYRPSEPFIFSPATSHPTRLISRSTR